ncbi:hypothetical protein ACFO1S_22490 [Cohnella boryungensis]|uniref:Uncharacterized protein n=1 Tax=Cohnella boryungensis TaxID=768479 RepID=A0ABV8SG45_9BACL
MRRWEREGGEGAEMVANCDDGSVERDEGAAIVAICDDGSVERDEGAAIVAKCDDGSEKGARERKWSQIATMGA